MNRAVIISVLSASFMISFPRQLCADEQFAAAVTNGLESSAATELRIYQDALLTGSNERRIDAAVVLLRRRDRESRAILLEALVPKDDPEADNPAGRFL